MSENNSTGLIMGGAALGAVALGYLWNKKTHEAEIDEKLAREETLIVERPLKTEKIEIVEKVPVMETKTEIVAAPTVLTQKSASVTVEEVAPVLQEVVHPVEIDEVQPIVHRDVKQTEVHQITQPIYDAYTAPTIEVNRELKPEVMPTLTADTSAFQESYTAGLERDTLSVDATRHETIIKPTLVDEVVQKDIIEVIQPVVHRDTTAPTLIHTTAPVHEKIVEQPVLVKEVLPPVVMSHAEVEAKLRGFKDLKVETTTSKDAGKVTIIEAPVKIN